MEGTYQIPFEQVSGSRTEEVDPYQKRKVYDNIHRFIYFPQVVWDFIDTPHFQRLRHIKQLGCLQYVFPGATHTRFEHSIGTAHLAKTFLEKLMENNPQLYKDADKKSAILTITLAGLLHDLGHGPYSHTFDSYIVTKISKEGQKEPIKWTHQLASEQLFMHLVTKQGLDRHLKDHEINRVRDLIMGQPVGERKWEFQIISNKINGIDVDKLDYFRRDAFHLGAQNIFVDHDLLMNEARIIDDEICYPTKYVEMVYNIFQCRYKLYKNYYFNLVSKGIELMICDILQEIKAKFDFRSICQRIFTDPSGYIKLTDNILEKVEDIYENILKYPNSPDAPFRDNFKRAVDILKRIKTRKIYKFVREFHYFIQEGTDQRILKIFEEKFKKDKLIASISKKADVPEDKICLSISDIGFGMKEANPMKKVGFFRKKELKDQKLRKIQPNQIEGLSMLFTHSYMQRSIKIFLKQEKQSTFQSVERAFTEYCKEINLACQEQLKQSGLNVIFEGRGGRTPLYTHQESAVAQRQGFRDPFKDCQEMN